MTELSAEKGYGATKIADVVRRAGVARKTLYDNFGGKEEIFLAAVDAAIEESLDRVEAACAAAGDGWSDRVAAGLQTFLAYLAENPAAAKICLVEAISATPTSSARYREATQRFVDLLTRNAPSGAGASDTTAESLVGGVAWILHQQVRQGGTDRALDLTPQLLDFILFPYQGVAEPGSGTGRRK